MYGNDLVIAFDLIAYALLILAWVCLYRNWQSNS